ncbi:response regulator [Streptomyces sp. SID14478]|uniref:response regulator n=1 Tax=Streptomyces sp. SID14478 TaxID=2706073 RepID=UPI0013DCAC1C|nr:response regulator [Streptomyces sp. SID14478]NEB77866.1 response regulator [Streptomyces sp. SID14478]
MPTELTVLLVDNHEESLIALEGALASLDCVTERAQSGEEALRAVLRGGIDLIILDVVMPGITGLEAARHLHRHDRTTDIPVVLLTGLYRHAQLAEEAYELDVADILTKPIDPWLLRIKVASHLRYLKRLRALQAEVARQATAARNGVSGDTSGDGGRQARSAPHA